MRTFKSGPAPAIRQSPVLDWGVSHVFSTRRSEVSSGKFADGRAVFTGGVAGDFQFFQTSNETMVFAADGLSFVLGSPIPTTVQGTEGCLLGDGRLLFAGSGNGGFDPIVQTIEPSGLTWVTQPNMQGNGQGARVITLPSGNALRIGGSGQTTIEEFDYNLNQWTQRPSMANARNFPTATVLSNGKVLITGGGFSNIAPEIYDPVTHLLSSTRNQPQSQNFATSAFPLPNGRVAVCYNAFTGPLFTMYTDLYDPILNKFHPGASMLNNWLPGTAFQNQSPMYDVEDGFIMFMQGTRISYYDWRHDRWEDRSFPIYPERGHGQFVQLDKNTFISIDMAPSANGTVGGGNVIPHDPTYYVLRGTTRLDPRTAPTFGGLQSVTTGKATDKAVLHWNPASSPHTTPGDINYFVYDSAVSGGQDFSLPYSNPYADTRPWAGTNTIELFGLIPGDHYFVVRARDMIDPESSIFEQPARGNFEANVVEVHYVPPGSIDPPAFNWTPTADMSEPRSGCRAIQLASGVPAFGGDNGRVLVTAGWQAVGGPYANLADAYSQDGLTVEPLPSGPDEILGFTVIDASPTINDSGECRHARVFGGARSGLLGSAQALTYWPYNRAWFPNDGLHDDAPPAHEFVTLHASAGVETHDIVRFGGIAMPDDQTFIDNSFTSNTVERLTIVIGQRIFYTGAPGIFTVGNTLTGSISLATGTIFAVGEFQSYVDVYPVTGNFFFFDTIDDGFASAAASFVYYGKQLQKWDFKTPMTHSRQYHTAINLDDGRVMVAGGDENVGSGTLLACRDIELYTPGTDTWTIVYGWNQNYKVATQPFTVNNFVAGIVTTTVARVAVDNNAGATGTFKFSNFLNGQGSDQDWQNTLFQDGENIFDANFLFDWNSVNLGGSFAATSTISGDDSGATALIVGVPTSGLDDNFFFGDTTGVMVIAPLSGSFTPGETFTVTDQFAVVTATGVVGSVTGNGFVAQADTNSIEYVRRHRAFPLVKMNDGRVMMSSGHYITPNYAVDIFDPAGPDLVSHANPMTVSRSLFTAHCFGDGTIGVFGGYDADNSNLATASVETYDPGTGMWTTQNPMSTPRGDHASILLATNRVLVMGGTDDTSTVLSSAEISDT